jgi:hypothetical protein
MIKPTLTSFCALAAVATINAAARLVAPKNVFRIGLLHIVDLLPRWASGKLVGG